MARQTSLGADTVDEAFSDVLAAVPSDTISAATRLRDVRGIWADVAGTLKVITEAVASLAETNGAVLSAANGVTLTMTAGAPLKLRVAYVLATGTAATGIKVFF